MWCRPRTGTIRQPRGASPLKARPKTAPSEPVDRVCIHSTESSVGTCTYCGLILRPVNRFIHVVLVRIQSLNIITDYWFVQFLQPPWNPSNVLKRDSDLEAYACSLDATEYADRYTTIDYIKKLIFNPNYRNVTNSVQNLNILPIYHVFDVVVLQTLVRCGWCVIRCICFESKVKKTPSFSEFIVAFQYCQNIRSLIFFILLY